MEEKLKGNKTYKGYIYKWKAREKKEAFKNKQDIKKTEQHFLPKNQNN